MSKSDGTSIGDLMKAREAAWKVTLPADQYSIIRVDGRAFHTLTKYMDKPFDYDFVYNMDKAAIALCEEIQGAVFAYTQSDEISVLVANPNPKSQPWFGGVLQKQVSIAASTATQAFNYAAEPEWPQGVFDARVFTLPHIEEVGDYFRWRHGDCIRNSISMVAQHHFSHKELHGKKTGQMLAMLRDKDVDWHTDYPNEVRFGRLTLRQSGEREVAYMDKRTGELTFGTAMRTWWETQSAPSVLSQQWFEGTVPALPQEVMW